MDLSERFTELIEKDENYKVALNLVQKNSSGKIWLIGGALSRSLNAILHGESVNSFDFDFIVERGNEKFDLPRGWEMRINKFGSPKFVKEDISIDYITLQSINQNIRRGLEPTIENFLSGNPFTIQAMAYDVNSKEIIGDVGLAALKSKTFEVNDLEQAKIAAEKKGISVNELILKKAKSMGFKPILI